MLVHFYPCKIQILTLSDVRRRNLKIQNNILLKLPAPFLCYWIAYDRLGTFYFQNKEIFFQPGCVRTDTYQPIAGKFNLFELGSILFDFTSASHVDLVEMLMNNRTDYLNLRHDAVEFPKFQFENKNEIRNINLRIRISRKRSRKST